MNDEVATEARVRTAPAARLRLEPDERRQQILRCAVRVFGDRPYAAVSTQDIADAAGVTRGLIHHYFGTKRGLYLEVVRAMVLIPEGERPTASGSLRERVEEGVEWFLGVVDRHAQAWVALAGAEGLAGDPEVERILAEADDAVARTVLTLIDPTSDPAGRDRERAVLRVYSQLCKGAAREWVREGALDRDQVRVVLVETLMTLAQVVLPALNDGPDA